VSQVQGDLGHGGFGHARERVVGVGGFVVDWEARATLLAGKWIAGDQGFAEQGEAMRARWAAMDVGSYQAKSDIAIFLPRVDGKKAIKLFTPHGRSLPLVCRENATLHARQSKLLLPQAC
jgi:hypothetical protein